MPGNGEVRGYRAGPVAFWHGGVIWGKPKEFVIAGVALRVPGIQGLYLNGFLDSGFRRNDGIGSNQNLLKVAEKIIPDSSGRSPE
jgi:hypothetical protein